MKIMRISRKTSRNITCAELDGTFIKILEKMKTKAREERREHTSLLKIGRITLFETWRKHAEDLKENVGGKCVWE